MKTFEEVNVSKLEELELTLVASKDDILAKVIVDAMSLVGNPCGTGKYRTSINGEIVQIQISRLYEGKYLFRCTYSAFGATHTIKCVRKDYLSMPSGRDNLSRKIQELSRPGFF